MSVKQNRTISLGFVTSVVNLKRQDMHLYRASRSGPVQLYGIPCSGAHDTHLFHVCQPGAYCFPMAPLGSGRNRVGLPEGRSAVGRAITCVESITPPSSATEGAHICARHPEPLVVRDATKRTTKFDKL